MANFNVNIFGTVHRGGSTTPPNGSVIFNLHVLQVEADVTPINFDMFIEFYAFPFNSLGFGTQIIAGGGSQPQLSNRKSVGQPQVIHIDQLTPGIGVPIYLSNCSPYVNPISQPGYPIPPCANGQNPFLPSCPTPSDFRLFSHPFQVKTNLSPGSVNFDINWSDIKSNFGTTSLITANFYLLPVDITIIADGCRYEKSQAQVRIYSDYFVDGAGVGFWGQPYCWLNPNEYPLGEFDKILVN